MKRIGVFISEHELDLLKEVDKTCRENYMSRSQFTKYAWRVYIKHLKNTGKIK